MFRHFPVWVAGDWCCLRMTALGAGGLANLILSEMVCSPALFQLLTSVWWSQGGGILLPCYICQFLRPLSHHCPPQKLGLDPRAQTLGRGVVFLSEPLVHLWVDFRLTCHSPPSDGHSLPAYSTNLPSPCHASGDPCDGLNRVPPDSVCANPNLQHLKIQPYLEIGPLKR